MTHAFPVGTEDRTPPAFSPRVLPSPEPIYWPALVALVAAGFVVGAVAAYRWVTR